MSEQLTRIPNPDEDTQPTQQEGSISWEEELSDLRKLIDEARDAYERQDPTSLQGFRQILGGAKRFSQTEGMTVDEFAKWTLGEFANYYLLYSALPERPLDPRFSGRKRQAAKVYRRINKSLTPREVRLIIKGRGLNGNIMPKEDLAISEGLKVSTQALDYGIGKLGWNLYRSQSTA